MNLGIRMDGTFSWSPNETLSNMNPARPTSGQIERLVEFLEQNPWIVKPVSRSRFSKMETMRKWRLLASILNAMGGVIKTERGWAKYWAERKWALKRKWSILKEQAVSGIEECLNNTSDSDLSPLDKRLVVLLEGFKSPHSKSTEQPKHYSYDSISCAASTSTGVDRQYSTLLSSDERMETTGQDTPSDMPKQCYPQLNLTLSSGQLDQLKGMRVTIATPTTTPDISATVKGTNHTNKATTINTRKRYIAEPLSKYQLFYNSDAGINIVREEQRKIDAKIKLADAIENVGRHIQHVTTALNDVTTAINRIAAVLENLTQELI